MNNSNINFSVESLKVLYNKKSYNESIDLLLKNKNIFERDIFHYNLGTLYAQKGELAVARYHLEKAKSIEPRENIVKNLNFVRQKLGLENEISVLNKVDQISFMIKETKMEDYVIVGLVFLIIFFISLFKLAKFKKSICFILLFLSLFSFGVGQFIQKNFSTGIILKDSELRTGPSGIYPARTVLKNGQKVILARNVDGWLKVVAPRALEGWLLQSDVGIY